MFDHFGSDIQICTDVLDGIVSKIETDAAASLKRKRVPEEEDRCVNGSRRGSNSKSCDYRRDDDRVEVKSSQVKWNKHNKRWNGQWTGIKSHLHDELCLVLYTPPHLHFFVHDGSTGCSTAGKATDADGRVVKICGPRGVDDWTQAVKTIIKKLGAPVRTYAFADHDPAVEAILARRTGTALAYVGECAR